MSTVFKRIIEGKLPATKVFENERILAIEDIHPVAPVHILIMPKKEIVSLHEMKAEDAHLVVEIVSIAQMLAKEKGIEKGYRLLTNHGTEAGQTVFHLHFHLIGGKKLEHLV